MSAAGRAEPPCYTGALRIVRQFGSALRATGGARCGLLFALERLAQDCADGFGAGGAGRVARYPRIEGGELVGVEANANERPDTRLRSPSRFFVIGY